MMDEKPSRKGADDKRVPPIPPRMTKAEWQKRDKTAVTLTRSELDHLAKLIWAGHALLSNERSVSPKLRAAMTRLGGTRRGYNWGRDGERTSSRTTGGVAGVTVDVDVGAVVADAIQLGIL